MPTSRCLVSTCVGALILGRVSGANAFERQWHAGVDVGYASLFGDHSSGGVGAGAHVVYGISDAFDALLELDVSHHPSASTNVFSAGAGLAYTLDVARIVPYAGLLVAGYKLTDQLATTAPGGQFALGVDYELDRHLAVGLEFRMHLIFATDPAGTLSYATTFARFEYLWGF